MKKFTKIAAVTTVLAASLISSVAMAESTTDTVNAYAGLQAALTLDCTPVSFGVWRVPLRADAGETFITLDAAANTILASGETTRVAQSGNSAWNESRGVCTLSGSTAVEAGTAAITIANGTDMAMSSADGVTTSYTGLEAAGTAADLTATLTVPTTTTGISSGSVTFYVGGVLTIPGTIIAANYGGYQTTTAATVTADDGV